MSALRVGDRYYRETAVSRETLWPPARPRTARKTKSARRKRTPRPCPRRGKRFNEALRLRRAAVAFEVGEAVVVAEVAGRGVVPPVVAERTALGVARVDDAVLALGALADHQQTHLGVGVVEEAVGDAGAGGKSHRVAGPQPIQTAVQPDVGRAFEHVDELLLGALGVRERGAAAGRQALVVDAEPGQAEVLAERRADGQQLVLAAVVVVVGPLDLAPMGDARRPRGRRHSVAPESGARAGPPHRVPPQSGRRCYR